MSLPGRPVCESAINDQTAIVFPNDINVIGTLYGGRAMEMADEVAAIVAKRHSGRTCVTLGIDSVRFLAPARRGDILIFKAAVNRVWRTSMEVGLKIFAEDFRKDTVRKLYDLKRELTRLRMAVSPLQDILGQLARSRSTIIDEESQLYFRDVHDHTVRINEVTDTLREMLTAAMSVNLSLVTIQQGEVVKRLAGWAGLLAAPTLITSWYGMNFEHMPELHSRHGYWVIIAATLVLCVGLWALLKRAKWL